MPSSISAHFLHSLLVSYQRADLLDEQLAEMLTERDGQGRRLETLRKKQQEERDKATQEMDEVKAECERQLDELRRKVRSKSGPG